MIPTKQTQQQQTYQGQHSNKLNSNQTSFMKIGLILKQHLELYVKHKDKK